MYMCLLVSQRYLETEVISQFPFYVIQVYYRFFFQEPGTLSRERVSIRRLYASVRLIHFLLYIQTSELDLCPSHTCLVIFYRYIRSRSIQMNMYC